MGNINKQTKNIKTRGKCLYKKGYCKYYDLIV